MKTSNFPAKKHARRLGAIVRGKHSGESAERDYTLTAAALLNNPRDIRTKKYRGKGVA